MHPRLHGSTSPFDLPILLLALSACQRDPAPGLPAAYAGFQPGPPPAELAHGAALFGQYCTPCHGALGTGQGLGPPLLDTLYFPGRLPDAAVARAISRGVPRQHWDFGSMPVIHRVEPADIPAVIGYLRWLQEKAGRLHDPEEGNGR